MNLELDNKSKKELVLFRDAELASYVDEKGLIKFAQSNEPRINYSPNPKDIDAEGKHKCLGIIIEFSSTNELIYSTDLTNNCWSNAHQITKKPENEVLNPAGELGDNKVISIIDLPGNDFHLIRQLIAHKNSSKKTVSIFVKKVENAGSKDFTIWAVGGVQIAVFSRKDWSFISGIAESTNVEYYPHNWVRLSATYSVNNNDIFFGTSEGSKSVYIGEKKKQFYLFGPQLEYLSTITSYIPTENKPRFRGTEIAYFDDVFYYGSFKVISQHIQVKSENYQQVSQLNNVLNGVTSRKKSVEIDSDVGKLVEFMVKKSFYARSRFYYRLILYSLPEKSENLIKLGIILLKQGWLAVFIDSYEQSTINNNQPKFYQNLAIHLSTQGLISEAVQCWAEAVECSKSFNQKFPNKEKFWESIWRELNEINPRKIDKYEAETNYKIGEIRDYFKNTSKYGIISLDRITDSDRQVLNNAGISLTNLKFIQADSIHQENIYINNFTEQSNFKLSELVNKRKDFEWPPLNYTRDFQQSIVETGYIYTLCPVTGKILRSNNSFAIDYSAFVYRFVGQEVFYLIVGQWDNCKLGVYFPKYDLVINMANELWKNLFQFPNAINELKTQAVMNHDIFLDYISSETVKPVVVVVGSSSILGHYLWQELGGLEYLYEAEILDRVDKFLMAPHNRLNIGKIFPEIPSEKLIVPQNEALFKFILKNNYLVVRVTEHYIRKGLESRINSAVIKTCSPSVLEKIEESRQSFPLLWINVREHNKSWVNQIDGYANIITKLSDKYPQIGVIIDGMLDTRNILEQIKSTLPDSIKTYNTLECKMDEVIAWSYAIDCYIAVVGSGLTFLTWLANKPGVAHANKIHLGQKIFWSDVRENIIEPVFIPEKLIYEDNPKHDLYKNYDFDWKIIYEEMVKIIEGLEDKKIAEKTKNIRKYKTKLQELNHRLDRIKESIVR
ncbi:MAG: hypothetical protein MGF17_00050 [Trichodesmium sp. MAG_R04]|nr:hypothetical protein [Trichodesmium sp. MAG_R04]